MLIFDTLRYDYAMENPVFKELSQKGLFFERMYSPSTFTNAIMTSVRTGMYPPRHGWRTWPESHPIGDNIKTIGSFLEDAGYTVSDDITMPTPFGEDRTEIYTSNINAFKEKTSQEPFFLYSQYLRIHDGLFRTHRDMTDKNYLSLVSRAGHYANRAYEYIMRQKFDNEILFIISSDHGVGLEKERLSSMELDVGAGQIYDFRNRAYCVFIGRKIKPQVLKSAYSLIDILPSILDYCGIDTTVPDGFLEMQGVSVFGDPEPNRYVYMEAQSPYSIWPSEWPNVFGATNGKVKLMLTPEGYKFYNLVLDPEEEKDLFSGQDIGKALDLIQEIRA